MSNHSKRTGIFSKIALPADAWCILVFAATFALYAATLAPGLTGGDSGELVCVAKTLGVAHPPGYPLWTLLAHLFSGIPWSNLAWRINLMSAVCGAGTAMLLFQIAESLSRIAGQSLIARRVCGATSAVVFALSSLTWKYSTEAEVFALNNLLIAASLWSFLRFLEHRKTGAACLCAVACGLTLSNHHTAIFVIGPVALVVAVLEFKPLKTLPVRYGLLVLAAILGLMPYAYLPLAANYSHGQVWGDASTVQGFLDLFLRREYGTFQLAAGAVASKTSLMALILRYLETAMSRLCWLGLPLGIFGLAWGCSNRVKPLARFFSVLVGVSWLLYLVLFQSLVNLNPSDPLLAGVLERFYLLPDLLLSLGVGLGMVALHGITKKSQFAWGFVPLFFLIPGIALNRPERIPGESPVASYGREILESLPPNSILLVRGDLPSNAVRYVQTAEGFRSDVAVLDMELLTRRWYVAHLKKMSFACGFPGEVYHPGEPDGFTLQTFFAANAVSHGGPVTRIFLYPEPKPGDASLQMLDLRPFGYTQEILPAGAPEPDLSVWLPAQREILYAHTARYRELWNRAGAASWERVVAEDYWSARHRLALALLFRGIAETADDKTLIAARGEYEKFLTESPFQPWFALKNLGMVYDRLLPVDPALKSQLSEVWENYLKQAPTDEKDRAAIAAELQRIKQLK